MGRNNHIVTVAPYEAVVTFCYTRRGWQGVTGEKAAAGVYGLCDRIPGGYVVGVFKGGLQTLIHEAVHCGLFILDDHGCDPLDSNGEQLAYMVEWLVKQGRPHGKRGA